MVIIQILTDLSISQRTVTLSEQFTAVEAKIRALHITDQDGEVSRARAITKCLNSTISVIPEAFRNIYFDIYNVVNCCSNLSPEST